LEVDCAVVTEVEHASCVLAFGEEDNERCPLHRRGMGLRGVGLDRWWARERERGSWARESKGPGRGEGF
jgi:hypothetical protein